MTTAVACAALAAAIGCAPPPRGVARFAALWPARRARHRSGPHLIGPVVAGALGGAALAGVGGALAGALVALVVRHRRAVHRAARLRDTAAEQLAAAVARITDELRAGSHPAAALSGIDADGPHARSVLAPAAVAARLGDGIVPALRRGGAGRPEIGGDVERIATAWILAERHGIPLADLLGRAHEDIRWRVRFASTVRAQLAGPRATAAVLTTLPVLGIGLGQLIGAHPIGVLRGGPLGQALLVIGVALLAAGSAWSERIIGSAVPR
ncbi:type II secretion system F family protein [Pseudonocardia zijingensis]|uniref:type II secretion system F family protein n=2 Tax=Pseudonocardia zijingensis TaxID=153376 RepID=UPI00360AA113